MPKPAARPHQDKSSATARHVLCEAPTRRCASPDLYTRAARRSGRPHRLELSYRNSSRAALSEAAEVCAGVVGSRVCRGGIRRRRSDRAARHPNTQDDRRAAHRSQGSCRGHRVQSGRTDVGIRRARQDGPPMGCRDPRTAQGGEPLTLGRRHARCGAWIHDSLASPRRLRRRPLRGQADGECPALRSRLRRGVDQAVGAGLVDP